MGDWIGIALDLVLIVLVGVGIVQAVRLINQLRDLRAGRAEMERFVRDFNSAVMRAEAGIKGLRAAARDTGDDLEKLVEKGTLIRDELTYIIESADSVAERLTVAASGVLHASPAAKTEGKAQSGGKDASSAIAPPPPPAPAQGQAAPSSRAEKELMQALQKMTKGGGA
ncbi:MAG: hypothetical protein KGI37_08615 [Alphaproteobacteria bacterium]|nr:hypothetical protein [Alphaproteobacteria bacterium]